MTRISSYTPIGVYVAALSIALIAGAAGCGGNSGSHRTSHRMPTPTATPTAVISGQAVQNGMSDAAIESFAVNTSDGSDGALLGNTTTDSDGNYSLRLIPIPTGPVRVTASGGSFVSEANGATISSPSTISVLIAGVSSGQTVNLNPLTDFVNSRTLGAINQSGTDFTTALSNANTAVETDFGLSSDPSTLTPNYTAAGIGTDAGNVGLALGAIINEDQLLCPATPGALSAALSADFADGIFDGQDFGTSVPYCGGNLAAIAGTSELEDAMSGLQQFGTAITSGFSFGGTGNILTANGVEAGQLLTPLALINGALANAAPAPVNTFLASGTAVMNLARFNATATLLPNGKVLIAGGNGNDSVPIAQIELYDPATNSFATTGLPAMNVARIIATATLLPNGKVLIAGGTGTSGILNSTELYDPASNTFLTTDTATMNVARSGATATLLPNAMVLIAGGEGTTGLLSSTELYDPATNSFADTGTAAMNAARFDATATLLPNGKVLIAGGYSNTSRAPLSSTELYDPASNSFAATETATMNAARALATATLLPNGNVLVAGGDGGGNPLGLTPVSSTELYDPATNSFATAGTAVMNSTRAVATATLLPNGKVLIAGGLGSAASSLSSTELYDPASNSFAATGTATMNTSRGIATGTLLPNGNVLIAGGGNSTTGAQNTTELYTP